MTVEAKIDEILERLSVLEAHAKILERHSNSFTRIDAALRRLGRKIDALDGSIGTVVESQREANQLLASIHSLWARLKCIRPRGKTPSSSEFRVVGSEEG